MSARVTRILMTVVSVMALTLWANHCILVEVFAATSRHDQRPSNPPRSHCHGDEGGQTDNSSKSGNHHSGCQNQGCCAPAIQASHGIDSGLTLVLVHLPTVVVAALDIPSSIDISALMRSATGPPIRLLQELIALCIAPNAPPL